MTDFYTDDELDELVTKLKSWSTYPVKELAGLTKLSRVTVSKWMNNRGNITAENKMLLWETAQKLIYDTKRRWASKKNKATNV